MTGWQRLWFDFVAWHSYSIDHILNSVTKAHAVPAMCRWYQNPCLLATEFTTQMPDMQPLESHSSRFKASLSFKLSNSFFGIFNRSRWRNKLSRSLIRTKPSGSYRFERKRRIHRTDAFSDIMFPQWQSRSRNDSFTVIPASRKYTWGWRWPFPSLLEVRLILEIIEETHNWWTAARVTTFGAEGKRTDVERHYYYWDDGDW